MLAEVDKLNEEGINESYIVGSADVEALYPSLDIAFTIDKVCELFQNSKCEVEGINYKELGLYLSLTHTDDQLKEKDIFDICPKRIKRKGPRPTITGCGMAEKEKERYRPWRFPKISNFNKQTKRKLFTEAIRTVLTILLETHTYEFSGKIRRQTRGGPIGMDITGVVAQVFMVWWVKNSEEDLTKLTFNYLYTRGMWMIRT